ncbi:MAG: c-type cytochrome [Acidobacteria bacterium]|nr:c-type cytochrome [Acidobacteriota bacterium]
MTGQSRFPRSVPLALALLLCALVLSCAAGAPAAGAGTRASAAPPAADREAPVEASEASAGRPPAVSRLRDGEAVYREYCVGCHGVKGDGQGPAARFLDPKPRDFTKGLFKFASVASGDLPRDEDLMRTITRGLPGSSMPAWQLLPEEQRRAVIVYLKTFSKMWSKNQPGTPIAVSENPFAAGGGAAMRQAVGRGKTVYHVLATCWQCHPSYATHEEVAAMAKSEGKEITVREGADRATRVEDAWDQPLMPTDFPRRRMKGGSSVADFYRTIASGIGGTAMPTWKGGLEERDLWALAYYVKSLADRRWQTTPVIPARPIETLARAESGVHP